MDSSPRLKHEQEIKVLNDSSAKEIWKKLKARLLGEVASLMQLMRCAQMTWMHDGSLKGQIQVHRREAPKLAPCKVSVHFALLLRPCCAVRGIASGSTMSTEVQRGIQNLPCRVARQARF